MQRRIDFSNLRCPLVLVKAKLELKQSRPGEELIFRVTDASFFDDLAKLKHKYHCELTREVYSSHEDIKVVML